MGVGYKARWFFLVIWLLVFFVWWAAYVEGTVACISDDFRWQPVRYLFGLILFDWRPSLGDLWSEPLLPLGINGVFGLYITGRPGSISWGLVPCILFIICSVPLLFGLVFGYVGVSREASRELVAKSPIGLLPRLISTCLAGLLFACALLLLIKLLSIKWNILTYYVFSGRFAIPDYVANPNLVSSFAFFFIGCGLWYSLLIFPGNQREQYGHLERCARWLLLLSLVLLTTATAARLSVTARNIDVIYTACFVSMTVFVWALGSRVLLLFQLKRFVALSLRYSHENPECFACGCNLYGSVMAGKKMCPECGASIPRELMAEEPGKKAVS